MDSSICKKSKNRHERQIEIETQKHMQTFRDTHPKKKGKRKKKALKKRSLSISVKMQRW